VNVPSELRYTTDHEWVRRDGAEAVVGITDFATEQLGDIVFVELPAVGTALVGGTAFGVVESVKAVSDLLSPLSATVSAVNEALTGSPELVNSDPYGEGWMIRVALPADADLEALLDADAYRALVATA
jgi:glycine cleavage system H protein